MATNSRFVRVNEWSIVTDNSTQRLNPCRKCFFRPISLIFSANQVEKLLRLATKEAGAGQGASHQTITGGEIWFTEWGGGAERGIEEKRAVAQGILSSLPGGPPIPMTGWEGRERQGRRELSRREFCLACQAAHSKSHSKRRWRLYKFTVKAVQLLSTVVHPRTAGKQFNATFNFGH